MTTSLTVKCIGCGAKAKIGPHHKVLEGNCMMGPPGEKNSGPPVCKGCGMPMLPHSAEAKPERVRRTSRRRA